MICRGLYKLKDFLPLWHQVSSIWWFLMIWLLKWNFILNTSFHGCLLLSLLFQDMLPHYCTVTRRFCDWFELAQQSNQMGWLSTNKRQLNLKSTPFHANIQCHLISLLVSHLIDEEFNTVLARSMLLMSLIKRFTGLNIDDYSFIISRPEPQSIFFGLAVSVAMSKTARFGDRVLNQHQSRLVCR